MPRLPRLAGVHATVVVVGMLAFTLVTGSASAQTPTATATPVVFEVTDEGTQQLLRMLRSRFLPAPARTTLAALLEQQGVSHDVLAKLFDRPRHCDDGHGSDGEHSHRCRGVELPRRATACVTATATATATASAAASATATATGTPRGDDDDEHERGCRRAELPRKATACATATGTATATATGTASATATASTTATASVTAKPERERCEKPEKKRSGTPTATVAPADLCRQALAATGETAEKLAERCAAALKADRELAATICAEVSASDFVTSGAKELKKSCEKLLANGTTKAKPTEATRVKSVGTQTSSSQKRR